MQRSCDIEYSYTWYLKTINLVFNIVLFRHNFTKMVYLFQYFPFQVWFFMDKWHKIWGIHVVFHLNYRPVQCSTSPSPGFFSCLVIFSCWLFSWSGPKCHKYRINFELPYLHSFPKKRPEKSLLTKFYRNSWPGNTVD